MEQKIDGVMPFIYSLSPCYHRLLYLPHSSYDSIILLNKVVLIECINLIRIDFYVEESSNVIKYIHPSNYKRRVCTVRLRGADIIG